MTGLKQINDVTYQLLHDMHSCIDTALNIDDTGPFSLGNDMIYICDDGVL